MEENIQKEIRWLLQEKYNGKRTPEAEKDIARLKEGQHVDYVIGWVNFLGCKIDLSRRPLIPRPETEYWVERVIERLRKRNFGNRLSLPSLHSGARPHLRFQNLFPSSALVKVLDLFAGSGCIGVTVLKHIPGAYVDFAEKDKNLLKQIEINAELNEIEKSRYKILQSDVFSGVKERYDYVLANPPYVSEGRREKVQQSVLEQEPYQAVFGGEDGLYYIRKFFREAKSHVVTGGVVYVEFDSYQKAEIEKLAKAAGGVEISIEKDQYGKWRYARIVF